MAGGLVAGSKQVSPAWLLDNSAQSVGHQQR